jgi:phosphonate C-P lyase system protein PhnH
MSIAPIRETGFDPMTAGQTVYRRLLKASAHPGTIVELDDVGLAIEPTALGSACLLLLSVLDRELSFHVLGFGAESVSEYLRFNTGARSAAPEVADFVLVTGLATSGEIRRVNRGRGGPLGTGATVVYSARRISPTPIPGAMKLVVATPNLSGVRRLHVDGIDRDDLYELQALGWGSLGVDIWLTAADGGLAVIPRSSIWTWED